MQTGVDVWDPALMRARPFAWLRIHIEGLVDAPAGYDVSGRIAYANRVQRLCDTRPANPVGVLQDAGL